MRMSNDGESVHFFVIFVNKLKKVWEFFREVGGVMSECSNNNKKDERQSRRMLILPNFSKAIDVSYFVLLKCE